MINPVRESKVACLITELGKYIEAYDRRHHLTPEEIVTAICRFAVVAGAIVKTDDPLTGLRFTVGEFILAAKVESEHQGVPLFDEPGEAIQ